MDGLVEGQAAPLGALLKKAMPKFQVTAQVMQDNWIDVGTPERLEQINEYLAEKGAGEHLGA